MPELWVASTYNEDCNLPVITHYTAIMRETQTMISTHNRGDQVHVTQEMGACQASLSAGCAYTGRGAPDESDAQMARAPVVLNGEFQEATVGHLKCDFKM